MRKYFAGIDGGGTFTKMVIGDENSILHTLKGEGINFYGLGLDKAKENLKSLFDKAALLGYKDFYAVTLGLSALNESIDNTNAKKLIDFIPAEIIDLHSDISIILKSLCEKPSAVIISGTGSVCSMIKSSDVIVTVGGLGHLVGDEGSSYYIGEKGLRAALSYLEGWGKETCLVKEMYDYLGTDNKDTIIDSIYTQNNNKTVIANFSVNVEKCAAIGDEISIEILKESAKCLFRQFQALVAKAQETPKILILNGSVLTNSPIVRTEFTNLITKNYPLVKWEISNITPEERALLLARSIYNIKVKNDK